MAEPLAYSSNPMASYCQSNVADFTLSQYLAKQGIQYPWDTIDSSLFHQKNPMDSMTAANTSFPQYVPETTQSCSQNNLLGRCAGEHEVANSVSSYDYKLLDLEPSLSDSSACSEVEDCATTRITLQQTPQNSTTTRRRSREKRANNKSRKVTAKTAASLDQTYPYRISKSKRTTSSSSDSEDIERTTLAKQTHSEIERKYRNNLNAKMLQLHRTLESTSRMSSSSSSSSSSDDSDSSQQAQPEQQPRKSDILSNALQYIDESELEMRHMSDEILRLKNRLVVLQRMVRCEGDCDALKQIVKMKMAS
ncbi:uncharacterized protein Z520_11932 [Fonsecaea multimorphosa CBS 102226]|uniref:BHLH domain-containing protein n=1 Tax=Fonsecaea multimorphosa CBS 102226 TaxID=1442371 RepID=A0A0D2JPD1_9EURO|nr:uncharacterized protein Z520_11932 [Fonsecaea multimorphosa CBS 102226]KIX92324.1 hypothetical protein Z520_11932 [Fonsecaea multimorphosa CBS 102226]OAL17700.1 hypothetical protein AYO22_11356 [Fonsecaea multimorphosa]